MEKENCGNNSPLEDYDENLINPPNDLTELASTSFIINHGIIDQSDSLKDEFYIHYKELAIEKVVAATKVLDENNLKEMYSCAASTSNETSNLLNVKHDGLESAYHLLHTLKEKVKIQKTKGEECRKKYDAEMASCLSTYQEMQKLRREHDPLWPKREQARLELFRLEVEYKMKMQKQKELKETENLRQEIRKKMRNAAIVELAEAMAERERCKKLTEEIEVAERKEAELAKQLESLELLAAEKNVEQEASTVMQSTFKPISIHSSDAKRLHELHMKDIDRLFFKTPPQQSTATRLSSSSHIERTSSPAKENKRVNVLDDTVIASGAQKKSQIQGNLKQEIIFTSEESENEISELVNPKLNRSQRRAIRQKEYFKRMRKM